MVQKAHARQLGADRAGLDDFRVAAESGLQLPQSQKSDKPRLNRETFRTSRLLEFCNVKELTAQTGHHPMDWPLVILKELGPRQATIGVVDKRGCPHNAL